MDLGLKVTSTTKHVFGQYINLVFVMESLTLNVLSHIKDALELLPC